uniref:BAT2 N-terminal domain-containing protein n=1 Tax=Cajanus cajan TaxID=3821 RepID=A0A151TT76_CAJCA|nr:hypothetical protein KK1_009466 [Cajanus cajan]
MTSSMLSGERRWASSSRRGGMTVLGKVAVPKPINLPSQRLENHGLDPNVEIVPKGTLSWGSRSSTSTSNAWGSSSLSPNTDGGTSSPSHLSARPSSGGSGTRPSTAGSDRVLEPTANSWGSNSRPSSASGILSSNQSSLSSMRPRSAETRPGSSQLSRFAEPLTENSGAWNAARTTEKLGVTQPKNEEFSLSSGDFPTLGSDKDKSVLNSDLQDHSSQADPDSSSGGLRKGIDETPVIDDVPVNANIKGGTGNSWRRDYQAYNEEGVRPGIEKWQGNSQPFPNAGIPPQHYDAWHGPPVNNPQGCVWFRGPPSGPPFGNPVTPGGFPIEPFPYYRPHMPPTGLANPPPVPPPGAGPRGHHKNGDVYRPHMPDAFIRPGIPIRPGFYPGSMAYEGYYSSPMGYCNSNERDVPFMGMAAGPPVYNRYPNQTPPEPGNSQEQVESNHPPDTAGPYRVLLKQHVSDGKNEPTNWEDSETTNTKYVDGRGQPRMTVWENEQRSNYRKNEEMDLRKISPRPSAPKDASLIQKIEGLNAKARDNSSARIKEEHRNKFHAGNAPLNHVENAVGADVVFPARTQATEIINPAYCEMGAAGAEKSVNFCNSGSFIRVKLKEIAKQRTKQLQEEEEERTRKQKAKALAKLDELNRRSQAGDGSAVNSNANTICQVNDPSISKVEKSPILSVALHQDINNADATNALHVHNNSTSKQKRMSYKQKQNLPSEKTSGEKVVSTTSITLKVENETVIDSLSPGIVANEVSSACGSDLPMNSAAVVESSVNMKKKNMRNNKNKQKVEESSSLAAQPSTFPKETNLSKSPVENDKSRASDFELDQGSLQSAPLSKDSNQFSEQHRYLGNEESHGRMNSQWKSQHSRRMPRNMQANRPAEKSHGTDAVMWAPVKPQNKSEIMDESSEKNKVESVNPVKNEQQVHNLKNKRAEMERYIPKPVAKEMAQQGNIQVASSSSQAPTDDSIGKVDSGSQGPQVTQHTNLVFGKVGSGMESKNRDARHTKQGKAPGSWRQRNLTESTNMHEVHDVMDHDSNSELNVQRPTEHHHDQKSEISFVKGQTKHFNDSGDVDGSNNSINDSAALASVPVIKDHASTGRGRRAPFRGHKGAGGNRDVDNKKNSGEAEKVETRISSSEHGQLDVGVASKENRVSEKSKAGEALHFGNQESKRERKNAPSKRHHHSPVQVSVTSVEQAPTSEGLLHDQRPSSGSGKNINQNRFRRGHESHGDLKPPTQDNRHYNQPTNRERQGYEYHPVGPYDDGKLDNFERPKNGNHGGGRFRERGQTHPRRGGGNSYGRQGGFESYD